MTWRDDPPFPIYEGETLAALEEDFVKTSAHHANRFSVYDVAKYVFRHLREPNRYMQAAEVWKDDLELAERIRVRMLKGAADERPEVTVISLQAYALGILNDKFASNEIKLKCVEFLARTVSGALKKDAEENRGGGSGSNDNAELLAALSKMLPS